MENINKLLNVHNIYMQRCLDLASLGIADTAPNPMVGAVLVYDNKIISEGYHHYFGAAHAEIDCIKNIPNDYNNPNIMQQSTLYVSLEPCCHHGKTPPCTDAIIKQKISKVVVGCLDNNSLVKNNGIERLKAANIEVIYPIIEKECAKINKRFFHFHQHKKPYFILKWAESNDAFIAKKNYDSVAISNAETNIFMHQMRANVMAIMVGTNTALYDNPKLTTRHVIGKNPIKILLDKTLRVPITHEIFKGIEKVFVINEMVEKNDQNVHFVKLHFDDNLLLSLMCFLYQNGILSVLVEGGSRLLKTFIDKELWQEACVIKNNDLYIYDGIVAPKILEQYLVYKKEVFNNSLKLYERF